MNFVIFDADDTLYSVPSVESAEMKKFIFLQEKTGIDENKLRDKWRSIVREILNQDIRKSKKRNREYSTKETLLCFGLEEEEAKKLSKKAVETFWKEISRNLKTEPEIKKIIQELRQNYRICVSSDEFRKSLEMKLNRIFGNWKNYFEFLVTANDTKELKPSKRFCQIPLEKFGARPEETVFVGDSWKRDLEVAKDVGLKTILIRKGKEGNPDYWIKNIKDINKVL